jgi:hypothetical protein
VVPRSSPLFNRAETFLIYDIKEVMSYAEHGS